MEPFFRRLLTAVLSLFRIGYVAYQGFQIVYNPIQTETAVEYSVYAVSYTHLHKNSN